MSQLAFAHAENRIQKFVLKPLSLAIIIATGAALYQHVWWAAGVFVLLWFYVGAIGARLGIHVGKSFDELAQGVTPNLAPEAAGDDVSPEEMRELVRPMVHVSYVVTIATVAVLIAVGVKVWWALLIGVVVSWFGSSVAGIVVAFASQSKHNRAPP